MYAFESGISEPPVLLGVGVFKSDFPSCTGKDLSSKSGSFKYHLGGGFKYFYVHPYFVEDCNFDSYFSDGLKPPTSHVFLRFLTLTFFWVPNLNQLFFCTGWFITTIATPSEFQVMASQVTAGRGDPNDSKRTLLCVTESKIT